MEFRGKIKGLAAKETKTGVSYAIAIEANLDEEAAAALMREIGESVRIEVEQPQLRLPLKPPKGSEQMSLDEAVKQGVAIAEAAAAPGPAEGEATPATETALCGEPAAYEISFAIDPTGAPAANGEPTSVFRCVEHAQEMWRQMDEAEISYISVQSEGRACDKLVPVSAAVEAPDAVPEIAPEGALGTPVMSECGQIAVARMTYNIATGALAIVYRCAEHRDVLYQELIAAEVSSVEEPMDEAVDCRCDALVALAVQSEASIPADIASEQQLEDAKVKFTDCKIQEAGREDTGYLAPLCENCGAPIGEDTASCPHCGAVQSKHLPDDNALASEPEQPEVAEPAGGVPLACLEIATKRCTLGDGIHRLCDRHASEFDPDGFYTWEPDDGSNKCYGFDREKATEAEKTGGNGQAGGNWWDTPNAVTPASDGDAKPKKSRKAKAKVEPAFEI